MCLGPSRVPVLVAAVLHPRRASGANGMRGVAGKVASMEMGMEMDMGVWSMEMEFGWMESVLDGVGDALGGGAGPQA